MNLIDRTFKNGEYVNYERRTAETAERAIFSVGINDKNGFSVEQKRDTVAMIRDFVLNGKKEIVNRVLENTRSVRHLIGLIESEFLTKTIKVKKTKKTRKIKLKVGKKVTDIALDEFYII